MLRYHWVAQYILLMKKIYQRNEWTARDNPLLTQRRENIENGEGVTKQTICRDKIAALFFALIMTALVALLILSLYQGNYSKIQNIVDSNGVPCGTGYNAGFNYLYYPEACSDTLSVKICVDSCQSGSTPSVTTTIASPVICSSLPLSYASITCPTTSCISYSSYAYLNKICLPLLSSDAVSPNLSANFETSIQLYNIYQSGSYLVIIAAGVIVIGWILFLLILCYPKILYFLITIEFVCLLTIGFFTMKYAQIRAALAINYNTNSLVINDESYLELLSFLCFGIYLFTFPIIAFGYKKIKYAILILNLLGKFFKRMITMTVFNILLSIMLSGLCVLQTYVFMNFLTYGTVVSSSSPFNSFSNEVVNVGTVILLGFGTYLMLFFLMCYSKFIVANNFSIWFYEETDQLAAFSPLRRSIIKSVNHVGSITLDALLFPLYWILFFFYLIFTDNNPEDVQQQDDVLRFFVTLKNKIRKMFQILYKNVNGGFYVFGAYSNKEFTEANRLYIMTINQNRSLLFGVGSIVAIFTTLTIIMLSIIGGLVILYYYVWSINTPAQISSLIVPIMMIMINSFLIGNIVGNSLGEAIQCAACYLMTEEKVEKTRMCYELVEQLNHILL